MNIQVKNIMPPLPVGVTFKVGNLIPNLGTLGLLGSWIIRYVRNGRTDRRTDKSNAYLPLLYSRGHYKWRRL